MFTLVILLPAEQKGFQSIFDGKTLKGWNGDPKFWSVKGGAITGQTTKSNPTKGNTFIIWEGGKLKDFILEVDFKIIGGIAAFSTAASKNQATMMAGVLVGIRRILQRELEGIVIQEYATGKHFAVFSLSEATRQH